MIKKEDYKLYNNYFNKDFRNYIEKFLGPQVNSQKFKEINFTYLFNLPSITDELKIKINENIDRFNWDKDFISSIKIRKEQTMLQLQKIYNLEKFTLSLCWRLIIGLGASHPQETSMTLHHIYGIPYIPGSAIKGVTRHWAVLKFAEEKSKKEHKNFKEAVKEISESLEEGKNSEEIKVDDLEFTQLIEIFGTQKQEGKVIFFDAYPVGDINLKIDIMNPHYPKYYSEGKPPADWQDPRPIKFLTVGENTKFVFYLASKKKDYDKNLIYKAKQLLLDALVNYGVGAKTSLGYGIFNEVS